MAKNLFTKPIDEISFDDIKSFFDAQIAENVRVDYKEDFPDNLAKYIVGFGNKFGGILLIGVKADKTKNVPISIDGIKLVDGLEEKVINISHANINPPITPEVKLCSFKSKESVPAPDKAIIIIRIDESLETPHMCLKGKDNRIYERIHNETRPAGIDSIKKLIEKSERGEKKFEQLFSEYITVERDDGFRTVFAIPAFPTRQIIHFNLETDNFLRKNVPRHLRFGDFRAIQNGVQFRHRFGGHTEITKEGLICYREPWSQYDFAGKRDDTVNIDRTMINLMRILEYSKEIYDFVGYPGKVCFGVEVTGLGHKKILPSDKTRMLDKDYIFEEDVITIKQFFSYDEFIDILTVVKSVMEIFFRSCGLVLNEKILIDWIEETLKK